MKAISVLFGGRLKEQAFIVSLPGSAGEKQDAFSLACKTATGFPGSERTVLFGLEEVEYPSLIPGIEIIRKPSWTVGNLLNELSLLSNGEYHLYYTWADCPLLDTAIAVSMAERHVKYAAEYSYADGWPYGFAPELLSPGTAGIIAKIMENFTSESALSVERDSIFACIQKDINSFDIETEISPIDLRACRLYLAADSKANLLLLEKLMNAGLKTAGHAERFLNETDADSKIELLRTLPAFYNIQVAAACPQSCSICPYPKSRDSSVSPNDVMSKENFSLILDKIVAFSGEAVVSLSLWGELSLHPDKIELIEMILSRPALSLVIETSGIGWSKADLEHLAKKAALCPPVKNHILPSPLSWIVSLDAHDAGRYSEVRGNGYAEAYSCARTLLSLFPRDTYVQAVRIKGHEDDIENFYRSWKSEGPDYGKHIIIQKYNDFAGMLEKLQASDLSPVKRRPCWHLKRDMNILINGQVPFCREISLIKGSGILGNAFDEDLSEIWDRGNSLYLEHCKFIYNGICENCDEYYTYNF